MPNEIAQIGLDIAKSIFHVHAADKEGRAVFRRRLKREEVEPFFRALPPCLVGLEACPGGHYWARLIRDFGHDVRLLPPQYVRPYVKTNKNDAADAEAICEAMTRPSMRFVPIKDERVSSRSSSSIASVRCWFASAPRSSVRSEATLPNSA